MAANSNSFIRVRLHFDYPPPAVVDCRMCWLLLDLNTCRVVADLESIIREKFEFSQEHIFVVRDNDSVRCVDCLKDVFLFSRVKVDFLAPGNGHSSCPDTSSKNCRKRQRPTEEDGPGGDRVSMEWKEKKRKKRNKEWEAKQTSDDEMKKSKEKCTEKKRKKAEKNSPAVTPKPASTKKTPASINQPAKGSKKPPAAQTKTHSVSSSDSSSSSSEDDEAPKKLPAPKPAPKTPLSTSAASKAPQNTKPIQTKTPYLIILFRNGLLH
uniref:Coilin N-terminal domain-containing protein n=1 Tax=Lates calcarifer TaxID=8187 RepID=A0A4W6CTL9_LATCA